MKYPQIFNSADLAQQMDQFDCIIDVRTPSEYAHDHIPGAINCPVLDDAQRIQVGTMYKQVGSFEAKRLGAALVAENISRHLLQSWQNKPREWRPLIYCWRGGNRSGSAAHIMSKIGWPVSLLEGGYKEYRRQVVSSLSEQAHAQQFKIICGPTGSGKSRLLRELAAQGAQVLDLEELAAHRGSVLGHLPDANQPSQKAFESGIWNYLRKCERNQPVFIEAESKKVGNLRVPEELMAQMRQSPCLVLQLSLALRVELLLQDYAHFVTDPNSLCLQLGFLKHQHGNEHIKRWQQMALAQGEKLPQLVLELLEQHYDPSYLRSMQRNFVQYPAAQQCLVNQIDRASLQQLASSLIQQNLPDQAAAAGFTLPNPHSFATK